MSTLLRDFHAGELRARDPEARRAAQTTFDRPLVLEAGAGTGKTTTLIGRLLAWTLGPGWERAARRLAERAAARPLRRAEESGPERIAADVLSRVVAITFTEAAAAEMAGRAARELGSLAAGGEVPDWLDGSLLPEPAERALRARALLGTLDHLAVRTIHAFCRGLLADHPLEAGVHPDLDVDAEGRRVEEVAREAVEGALREGYGTPGDPDLLALAAKGHGPQEIVEALLALLADGLPAAALNADPFRPEEVSAFRERLAEAARAVHQLIAPRVRGSRARNAGEIERGLGRLLDRLEDAGDVKALAEQAKQELPDNLVDHLKKWTRKLEGTEAGLFGDVRAPLAAAVGVLRPLLDHLGRLDPELLGQARRALRPLLAEVERELCSRGIATFDFLLTGAEALLARHPDVRRQVRRRIDQLLVDEFQDTDRTQCEILRWIALDGPADERPGLFLVGDPKQSIYGWRSADLKAYDGFIQAVRAVGGEVRSLVLNFRSVPAILEEVARVVEPVMIERSGLQPPFEPLFPCDRRSAEPGFVRPGWGAVEHWVSWKKDGDKGVARPRAVDAAEIEAEALAADVRALHEREGVAWREIAVLLRGTSDLDTYLEALRRARVPFAVGRDKQYYRRREIIEAVALVRAVLDPGDHLALLTVLRSSTVGVPDAALVPLWNRQLPKLMTELAGPSPATLAALREAIEAAARAVPADVPGIDRVRGWEKNLLAAVESLAVLRRSFETDPADVFVERLRGLFLLEATEAARYLGPYRLANLDRFFRHLLAAIEDGGGDLTAILRALRRSVAEAREAEEGRPKDGTEDAVSILTIHGAKGLDFEHVYLVQLHKTSPGDRGPRTEAGRTGGRFEYRLFGAPTLGFDRVEAERREVEAAERVRLLYVAMTRAKDRLVLTGIWPENAGAKPPELARTHMELLLSRPGVPPDLASRWSDALSEEAPWTFEDAVGALWKFPALRPAAELGLSAEPEAPSLPAPEEIAFVSAALSKDREEAAGRMARPFGGAASEEAHALLREQQAERLATGAAAVTGERRKTHALGDRAAAMAAGGAVHRALEEWDLSAPPAEETARQRALLPAYLATLVEGDELQQALPLAGKLLDLFAAGPLLGRLRGLEDHLIARELPVLLPPGSGDHSPVGVVAGTIDLLYRDPKTGRLAIADYKTDEVQGKKLKERAAVYAPQGALYARAIREALDLDHEPRFELWFLRAGRVVETGS